MFLWDRGLHDFVGALPLGRLFVVCGAYRDEGVAPTGDRALHFVGAPPSGRWVVVCEAYRDEGVAPTKSRRGRRSYKNGAGVLLLRGR